ncbi:MAG: sodium-dependent transporter, partial [Neisseria sp.]
NMNGGSIIGLVFFVLVAFAAITSSISLLEPVVEFLEERTPLSRKMSTLVAATVIWALGILALLSFNVLSDVKWFGLNIFDFLDYITSKIMMPLGGLGVIIFVGWFMNQKIVQEEVRLSGGMFTAWQILSRVIAPIGVIIVFIFSLIL